MSASERLTELDIELPATPVSLGAYAPAKRVGTQVFTSGQLPIDLDGNIITGEALGAAIPFALAIARELAGADAAARVKNSQWPRPQLVQQRLQILPEDRLPQLALGGTVNIARKLFRHVIKIAILHRASLLTSPATKGLFCHTHGENEAIWCNIPAFMRSDG